MGRQHRRPRHQPGRRAEARHAAPRGRHSDRSPVVGAEPERRHPGRERGCVATGGSAGRALSIVGVARGPVQGAQRVPAEGQIRHVRLADNDRARLAQPSHGQLVALRHKPRARADPKRGGHAFNVEVVLDRDRHALERSAGRAGVRLRQRRLEPQVHERAQRGVPILDPRGMRLHHLSPPELASPHELRDARGAQVTDASAPNTRSSCSSGLTLGKTRATTPCGSIRNVVRSV